MDLNQINNFITVAQMLSFSGAARRNAIPQSTVSRQISDLELQLGAKLFFRTKREVRLTQEGRAFLPYARQMLEAGRKGALVVQEMHRGVRGRLSVSCVLTSNPFLTQCLRIFGQRYPDILVDIVQASAGECKLGAGGETSDLYFLHRDLLPQDEAYSHLITHWEPLVLAVAKEHKNAGKSLNFEQMQQEKFILLSEAESPILYMQLMEMCTIHHFSPRILNQCADVHAVLLSVAAGLGVSVLPACLPRCVYPNLVDVCSIDGIDTQICYVVAWEERRLSPAAALFLEVVREVLAQ